MHWGDVQFSCNAELLFSFAGSRKFFDSPKFIFLATVFQHCNWNSIDLLSPILGRVFGQGVFRLVACGCLNCDLGDLRDGL